MSETQALIYRYERDCLRKSREAKTIEPLGMNKRDEL